MDNEADGEEAKNDRESRQQISPQSQYSKPGNMQDGRSSMESQRRYEPRATREVQGETIDQISGLARQTTVSRSPRILDDDGSFKIGDQDQETKNNKLDLQPESDLKKREEELKLVKEKAQRIEGGPVEAHGDTRFYEVRSLYCLSYNNCLRKKIIWLVTWNYFDHFITFVILINSIMLGIKDYQGRLEGEEYVSCWNENLDSIGLVLSAIFLCECVFKIIGQGFVLHRNAYLRDFWNWLDFFVVLISLLDFFPQLAKYSSLKILRTLRILRPLRSINKVQRMKMLINAMIKSIPGLLNVVLFLSFVLTIFGVFGVNQFLGSQYKQCRATEQPALNPFFQESLLQEECTDIQTSGYANKYEPWQVNENAQWLCTTDKDCEFQLKNIEGGGGVHKCGSPEDKPYNLTLASDNVDKQELIMFNIINFNNYIRAMLTIFVAITLEGWVLMMYNYMDCNSQPVSIVFFVLVVILGNFLLLNLVLAQIMQSFYASQEIEVQKQEMIQQKKKKEEDAEHKKDLSAIESSKDKVFKQPNPEQITKAANLIGDGLGNSAFNTLAQPSLGANKLKLIQSESESDSEHQSEDVLNPPSIEQSDAIPPRGISSAQQPRRNKDTLPSLSPKQADIQGIQDLQDDERRVLDGENLVFSNEDVLYKTKRQVLNNEVKSEEEKASHQDVLELQGVKKEEFDSSVAEAEPEEADGEHEQDYDKASRERAESNAFYRFFYRIVTDTNFNAFIFLLIMINTVTLAMDDYPQSKSKTMMLDYFNQFFTWFFFVEMFMKIVGLGPRNYIKDSFNLFDAFVVCISLIDWTITLLMEEEDIGDAAGALQALRAMRLLRVIKLARQWTQLQDILGTIMKSLQDIMYFGVLLFLFIYIKALLGMELFANRCRFEGINADGGLVTDVQKAFADEVTMNPPRNNFDDISSALTTVFIIILGEDWPAIMYNYSRVYGGALGYVGYFIVVFSLGNLMLLSLFTAILLQNFEKKEGEEEEEEQPDSPSDQFSILGSLYGPGKKPCCSVFKSIAMKFKLSYISAFGTVGAQKNIQVESDEFFNRMLKTGVKEQKVMPMESEPNAQQLDSPKQNLSLQNAEHEASIVPLELALRVSQTEKKGVQITDNKIIPDEIVSTQTILAKRKSNALQHLTQVLGSKNSPTKAASEASQKLKLSGDSLCCFSKNNAFRLLCSKMMTHRHFDNVILVFIIISTILLAVETPLDDPNSQRTYTLIYIDYAMTAIFTIEMLVKIFALGFACCGPESYIRQPANLLDFVIVFASLFSIFFSKYKLGFLKSLRMLRILRPLRLIARNRGLKLAIITLINSIPDIANMLMIVLFFLVLIGILSTTLFCGKFYSCVMPGNSPLSPGDQLERIKTKWDCLNYGGEWENKDLHFDTATESIMTLFTIQTTEGWIDVMWFAVDAVGQDEQPILNHSRSNILLFIVLIMILSLLFLNLFVGVVIETFNKEKETLSLNNMLSNGERDWINVQLLGYRAKPLVRIREEQHNVSCFRNWCIKITNNAMFDSFIMGCIILNTIVMGLEWYEINPGIDYVKHWLNLAFMIIFTVEAVIKIMAMQCAYFKESWNIFDFTVVIATLVALSISMIPGLGIDLGMQVTVVRMLRIMRVLRIIKKVETLQIIFETLLESLPALGSLSTLMMLFFFLFAIIGVSQFSMVQLQSNLDDHANFQTFPKAFLLLLRCATGEGWNTLMADAMRSRTITFPCDPNPSYESIMKNNGIPNGCGNPVVARIYFFAFMIVVSLIFLNLFIAIVVDTFIGQAAAFSLPIKQNDIDEFIEIWRKYDPEASGYIPWRDIDSFIRDLNTEQADFFKINRDEISNYIKRRAFIMNMEIPIYDGFKYFMFYDIIQLVCRHASQMKYYSEKIESLKDVKTKIKIISQFEGKHLSEEQLQTAVNNRVYEEASKEFNEIVTKIDEIDANIEIVQDFKHEANKIGKKISNNVDTWGDAELKENDNLFGVYTSQHVLVMLKVAQKWKRVLEGRQAMRELKDGNVPVAAREPLSHRPAKSTPRSVTAPQDTKSSLSESPVDVKTKLKRVEFKTTKMSSHELTMPPIMEEEERVKSRNIEGIEEIPSGRSPEADNSNTDFKAPVSQRVQFGVTNELDLERDVDGKKE